MAGQSHMPLHGQLAAQPTASLSVQVGACPAMQPGCPGSAELRGGTGMPLPQLKFAPGAEAYGERCPRLLLAFLVATRRRHKWEYAVAVITISGAAWYKDW